jgi:dihydrolipoamide dehydrogenase
MVMGSLSVETELLVIGGGPGGYVAAIRAAQLGREVIVVEKENNLGGVCLNVGCIPTKAMIHASNYYHVLKDLETVGITVKEYSVDINKMREWKNGIVKKLNNGISALFQKYDIEVINGTASFVSDNEVHISGKSDVTSIKFQHCIIATGSSPIELPGLPYDGTLVVSSTEILDIHEVPKKVAIIGGGYIGTEMGTVLGKLGSEVTIIEALDTLVSTLDQELVDVVARKLKDFNVKAIFQTKALGYEKKDNKLFLKISKNGKEELLETEKIVVVVGRKPNSKDLGLEKTSVKLDAKGFIIVDDQLRTNSKNIFAIGDVIGQPMLAHKASREGKIAAEVISGLKSAFDNKVIPFVIFNDPEIASVGMTEQQAKEKGHEIITGKFPFSALGRALTLNQTDGFVKIVADKSTNIILGVHAVGPNVSDLISEAALAIEMSATVDDIADTIHPHPTLPESLMEAAEVTLGKGIHIFMPKEKNK